MDPNAALNELREMVAAINNGRTPDLEHLAEVFEGLDDWISRGGFLPTDWFTMRREI